jgi:phosphoribosylanthranilate isomerase
VQAGEPLTGRPCQLGSIQWQRNSFGGREMGYHVRVKICGVTTPIDARLAVAAGADAIGLNFYAKSPRYVDDATAAVILQAFSPFVEAVGVFADEASARMVERMQRLPRGGIIQAHGVWPEPKDIHPYSLILAVAVSDAAGLGQISEYLERCRSSAQVPAAVLVDARVPGLFGGTGKTAPWDLLADFCLGVPLILAGGLTPENVAEAVRTVRPYAVDVASGVEVSPGRKDPERVRRFIDNARAAAAGL